MLVDTPDQCLQKSSFGYVLQKHAWGLELLALACGDWGVRVPRRFGPDGEVNNENHKDN